MSARVAVAIGAGVAALGGAAALVWGSRRGGAPGVDVIAASVPHGDGAAMILPTRVTGRPDFVAQMRAAMSLGLPMLNRNGRQLMIAHAAYESGFGTGKAFRAGWNFGNITCTKAYQQAHPGGFWLDARGDTEFAADGAVRKIDQAWRKYAGLGEAVADYWGFLGGSRYVSARKVLEFSNGLDADPFAANLRAGGYFTLPLAAYQRGLAAVLAEVTALWTD